MKIRDLKPDPRNARKHTTRNVGSIEQALREVGAGRSIVIDEDGVVLAGNATIKAAQAAGIDSVQVVDADGSAIIAVRRTGLSAKQKQRLALFDNRAAEQAEWDTDTLAALLAEQPDLADGMWLADELSDLLGVAAPARESGEDAPEPPAVPITQPGDLWILGAHRIICGDSTDAATVARVLDGAAPHLMVTDPPYGVEYDADWRNKALRADGSPSDGRAVGKVRNDDVADWTPAWRLFAGDVAYVWHAGRRASEVQRSLEAADFAIRCQIVWAKSNFAIGRGDYHWKHEPCWYAVRNGKTGHWSGDRSQTTLWDIDKPQKSETGHSTQKPIECMARPIRNNSEVGDAVYEPFSGSGTTLIACEQLGRRCYAIELDPAYVDVAVQRWETLTGKKAERVPA